MKRALGLSNKEIGDVFAGWNSGVLDSFLIAITRDIMYKNDDDGIAVVEKIMDTAGQKGTGKWSAIDALDLGMPVTLIGEAVFARCLSSLKAERGRASDLLHGPKASFTGDKQAFIDNLEQALYASKIISYAQRFHVDAECCCRVRVEAKHARDRSHVAWGVHHPLSLPKRYHQSLPRESGSRQPAL